jgi:hypothetical protein
LHQRVGNSLDQGRFGAHYDKVNRFGARSDHDPVEVLGRDVDQLGISRDARVAGCA